MSSPSLRRIGPPLVACGAAVLLSAAVATALMPAKAASNSVEPDMCTVPAGAQPSHNHIGHVMTSWKDTPATQGFLPVAIADAKVAATHAGYMQKSPENLDSLKLHAGHVLNALDPSIEM